MSAHHRDPDYRRRAARLVDAAKRNPLTVCWRCGRTLDQCVPHADGTPARWTAGHTVDGDNTAPLMAECSPCNFAEGGRTGAARRKARRWPRSTAW